MSWKSKLKGGAPVVHSTDFDCFVCQGQGTLLTLSWGICVYIWQPEGQPRSGGYKHNVPEVAMRFRSHGRGPASGISPSHSIQFICKAPFAIKLSLGTLQSQKPRAPVARKHSLLTGRNLEQDPAVWRARMKERNRTNRVKRGRERERKHFTDLIWKIHI